MALEILGIPVLSDNYVWALRDRASGQVAVVDPAVTEPVLAAINAQGWKIDWILNTHHHPDHIDGNLPIQRVTGCRIAGAATDAPRLPGLTDPLADGAVLALGATDLRLIMVPGHTRGHCAWYAATADVGGSGDGALFCGDALFVLGCGRMFEGTAATMWTSLARLLDLPDATRIYCAHEYTESNARFALSIDGANPALRARVAEITKIRARGEATVPGRLDSERALNPFLRAGDPDFAAALGLAGQPPSVVFGHLRSLKDRF